MKKSSIVIIILVTIFTIFLGYRYFSSNENLHSKDASKFKKEYEKFNGETNSSNGKEYPKVQISSNNVIKYSSYDEILEILKVGTGVIYLGYPECPWCRNLVPTLLQAASEVELDTIYYLNISDDRDFLVLDENKQIKTEKNGTKEYYKLVDALSSILDDYILTTSEGEQVNVNRKRIYVPLVVFVKDGKIVAHHLDTVESQKDPYILLNDVQEEELLLKLMNLMGRVTGSICDEKC